MVPFGEWRTQCRWRWRIQSCFLSRLIWGSCAIYQRISQVRNWISWCRSNCTVCWLYAYSLFLSTLKVGVAMYLSSPWWKVSRRDVQFPGLAQTVHQQVLLCALTYSASWKVITRFWRRQGLKMEDSLIERRTLLHRPKHPLRTVVWEEITINLCCVELVCIWVFLS